MAENKKSFLFYVDWKEIINELDDKDTGTLVKHILSYVSDENPPELTGTLKMAFIPIKSQLKRDLKKWEGFIDKQSLNGKKGGRPKTQKTQAFSEKPKKAVTVTVTDTVTVNDTDNVTVKENKELIFPFFGIEFLENWNLLITQKNWKKKSNAALQASLNKLGRYPEHTAIQMIQNTIVGEWKGLFEIKQDKTVGKMETFLNNMKIASNL